MSMKEITMTKSERVPEREKSPCKGPGVEKNANI